MNLLTVKQAQEKLCVSQGLIYKILNTGELPAVRIRSAWRIREQDLDEYINRQLTGGDTDAQEKERGPEAI